MVNKHVQDVQTLQTHNLDIQERETALFQPVPGGKCRAAAGGLRTAVIRAGLQARVQHYPTRC
jgi:hypothetical protein